MSIGQKRKKETQPLYQPINPSLVIQRPDARFSLGDPTLVDLKAVNKIYQSRSGKYLALENINLSVYPGEFLAIVGKSGSGKSTLLNMITGIDRPTTGEIVIANTKLNRLSEGKMAIWRGRNIGVVFQFFQLLPTLTVIENVMLPMDFCHKFSLRQRKSRALDLLRQVGLEDQKNKLPASLSGGQQQRVAIARALANDPPIIVADEPTGNLDSVTAAAMLQLFHSLVEQGKTIIMVSHDQDLVQQTSRTIYLVDGRIVRDTSEPTVADEMAEVAESEAHAPSEQITINLQAKVQQILQEMPSINNPTPTAQRLKEEVLLLPMDQQQAEETYQIVLKEISEQATLAEKAGRYEHARSLWKILIEATDR